MKEFKMWQTASSFHDSYEGEHAFLAYGREFYGADKWGNVYTFNVQFCWTENFAKIFLEFVRQISN